MGWRGCLATPLRRVQRVREREKKSARERSLSCVRLKSQAKNLAVRHCHQRTARAPDTIILFLKTHNTTRQPHTPRTAARHRTRGPRARTARSEPPHTAGTGAAPASRYAHTRCKVTRGRACRTRIDVLDDDVLGQASGVLRRISSLTQLSPRVVWSATPPRHPPSSSAATPCPRDGGASASAPSPLVALAGGGARQPPTSAFTCDRGSARCERKPGTLAHARRGNALWRRLAARR